MTGKLFGEQDPDIILHINTTFSFVLVVVVVGTTYAFSNRSKGSQIVQFYPPSNPSPPPEKKSLRILHRQQRKSNCLVIFTLPPPFSTP